MFAAMAASAGGVLTFKTNVYNIQGTGNAFHFVVGADVADAYIDVDCGFGPTEYPVDISTIRSGHERTYGNDSVLHCFRSRDCHHYRRCR